MKLTILKFIKTKADKINGLGVETSEERLQMHFAFSPHSETQDFVVKNLSTFCLSSLLAVNAAFWCSRVILWKKAS